MLQRFRAGGPPDGDAMRNTEPLTRGCVVWRYMNAMAACDLIDYFQIPLRLFRAQIHFDRRDA
jgi:hypothetical protein